MSIFPRVVRRGRDGFVTLHMHLENNDEKDVVGIIRFVVINPFGKKKRIGEKVMIKKQSKIDKYYRCPIRKNAAVGRYWVDGRFLFKGEEVKSETYKTDFFDIIDE